MPSISPIDDSDTPVAAALAEPLSPARVPLSAHAARPHIRRLHRGETDILRAHLLRLSPDARRLRFGNPVNDHFIDRYAAMALGDGSLVKGLFVDGGLRGVAELRFLSEDRDEAEGALSIEPDFQGHGHGGLLFSRLIAAARNRGVRRLFLTCLRENRRMQAIAARNGADLSFAAGEVTAEIRRPYADATSLSREWADESQAIVFALIDWRGDGLRALKEPLRRLQALFTPRPSRLRSGPASG